MRRRSPKTPVVLLAAALAALLAAVLVAGPRGDPGVRAAARAIERLRTRDVAAAVREADLACLALPESDAAASLAALARFAAGDASGALARLDDAARLAPSRPEPPFAAGALAMRLSRVARNGDDLRRAARARLDDARRRADRARDFDAALVGAAAALAMGDADDAVRRAHALDATTDDERARAIALHAAALCASGSVDAAVALLDSGAPDARLDAVRRRIESVRSADPSWRRAEGLAAFARNDAAAAVRHLAPWVDAHPADPAAIAVLARAVARSRDEAEFGRRIERLGAQGAPAASLPWFIGNHRLELGRWDDAARAFDEAERAAPGDPSVARGRADAALGALCSARRAGLESAHVESLAGSAASRPRDPVPWFVLGVAAESRGDFAAAERAYRRSLEADPQFGPSANNLAWVLATARGRATEAVDLAEVAVARSAGSAQARDTRGWVRFLSGNAEAAEPDLAAARRGLPGDALVATRHARVLLALRRLPDARRALDAAVAADPSIVNDPDHADARRRASPEASR